MGGALLRMEPLTPRKTAGVVIASVGVAVALLADLGTTPAGAWRGDLFMVTALAHHSHNDAVALKLETTSSNCSRARVAGDPSSCLKLANTQGTRPDAQRITLETRSTWHLLGGRYDYSSSLPPSRRKASSFSRWR